MTGKLSKEFIALVDEVQAMSRDEIEVLVDYGQEADLGQEAAQLATVTQFKLTVGPHMCGMTRDRPAVCIRVCQAMAANGLPILSIGSGIGLFEGFLASIGIPVTCIDPEPFSFNRTAPTGEVARFITLPQYKTVDDYCAAQCAAQCVPQTVNLLINWPWPGDNEREPYDYDAIVRLKPAEFVVMYGPCGGSGSEELIEALTGRDGEATFFEGPAASLPVCTLGVEYRLMSTDDEVHGSGYGFAGRTVRCARYARV